MAGYRESTSSEKNRTPLIPQQFLAVRTDANKDLMNAIRKELAAFDKAIVISQGDSIENLWNMFSA
jgi:hypothetical protein